MEATVTPGYAFEADSLGRILMTRERLNLLGRPGVSVDLAGAIVAGMPAAGAVSWGKLAAGVNAAMVNGTGTVNDFETGNTYECVFQAMNGEGVAVAAVMPVWAWVTETYRGDVVGFPGTIGVSGSSGRIVKSAGTDAVAGLYLSNASGYLRITFNVAGALTRYVRLLVGGRVVEGSKSMVWI